MRSLRTPPYIAISVICCLIFVLRYVRITIEINAPYSHVHTPQIERTMIERKDTLTRTQPSVIHKVHDKEITHLDERKRSPRISIPIRTEVELKTPTTPPQSSKRTRTNIETKKPTTHPHPSERTRTNIELTVRMSLPKIHNKNDKMLRRLFCMFLNSAVVFWNSDFGDVVFILDEADRMKNFEMTLRKMELPFQTRVAYEKAPGEEFDKAAKDYLWYSGSRARPVGYAIMFYSSFLFDLYTTSENTIVAWFDLDSTFTMPVIKESIFKDGRLIVKGNDEFERQHAVRQWIKSTEYALGLPMPSNFMAYFPSYIYASTFRNCREYIRKKFGASDFKEAFITLMKFHKMISPVDIILTYAYHFERERYYWHIDIGTKTLKEYNEKRKLRPPLSTPLNANDTTPELHVAVHRGYYKKFDMLPLQQGICYAQIRLGMKNIKHCDQLRHSPNMQLFTFEDSSQHVNTWCGGERKRLCHAIIEERYRFFVQRYKGNQMKKINVSKIDVLDRIAKIDFHVNCPKLVYVPFQ